MARLKIVSRLARRRQPWLGWLLAASGVGSAATFVGCSPQIDMPAGMGSGTGASGPATGTGATNGGGTGSAAGTGATNAGTGGTGVGGVPAGTGGTGTGVGGAPTGTAGSGGAVVSNCGTAPVPPSRAPLRRLTRFEYNNTVTTLLADTTSPANSLPTDPLGNGFGNDADAQSVSNLLAEQYGTVAEGIAARATATPAALTKLAACGGTLTATSTAAVEETCARSIITALGPRAYRRPLTTVESDELFTLYRLIRTGRTFASGIAAVIEGVLQSPDFLYRVELGVADRVVPTLRRPSGPEMATRLSYLFWGTMPDDALMTAANAGTLLTKEGVLAQATRLLDDQRSRTVVRFFFDNLLPINSLSDLSRDKVLFPAFSPAIGTAMREETQQFLEYEIFQAPAPGGTWPSVMTAPYTFVNDALAGFYGMTGVTGANFRKVNLPDTTKRLGLLTQAGVMAGTITTNQSNPVLRGTFIVNKLLCLHIELPTDPAILAMVIIPSDTTGATARERFSKHSTQAQCAGCHAILDPMGFALENFDPVGQYRAQENGVNIDASGSVPTTTGAINGPVELARKLATSDRAQACFATHWMDYGYGRTLGTEESCSQTAVNDAFKKSGYNVKQLLLALTQSDTFLYLPAQ